MKTKLIIKILLALIFAFSVASPVFASETDGTIVTGGSAGYAWSNQAGWVNFGITNGNIHITDVVGITGYAWNTNYGWINMAPTNGGILVAANGALSGYAWGSSLGWINFSGVSINSSGKFVGQASGTIVGTLTFDCANCDVRTDYRPVSVRSSGAPAANIVAVSGSGGGGIISSLPVPPVAGFSVVIQDGAGQTDSQIVNLKLDGGPDASRMAISNTVDFYGVGQEAYQAAKAWALTDDEGVKTVYVKFYNQYGQSSPVVSDMIIYQKPVPAPTPTSETPPVLSPVSEAKTKEFDVVRDGVINIIDFNALMVNWDSKEPGNAADMNKDGIVDIFDFNLIMVYWGVTYTL